MVTTVRPEILLTIAGSELNHPDNACSWEIHSQEDVILWLNCARTYPPSDPMHRVM
jgi:hypothetical protein